MSFGWYLERLKLMSFKELIFFRVPQQYQKQILGKIQKKIKFNPDDIIVNNAFVNPSYHGNQPKLLDELRRDNKTFKFFNTSIDLSENIDWRKDYKNNISSPSRYYGSIKKQSFDEFGDVKYVWEPSRLYFLPFLALSAKTDPSNKATIHGLLSSWQKQNPYLNTIHWTSGIEVAIRSVNIIYTHMVLRSITELDEELDNLIKTLIQYHYHFLEHNLSLYSSANNHLVAELAGLVVISCYFENKIYSKNLNKWIKKLFSEIENQINDDGVNMELSSHYHAEVVDHFFNALVFIDRRKIAIPSTIKNKLKKSFDFVNHIEYNGNRTLFGDSDDGYLIYPYYSRDFSLYQSLLQSSNIFFGTRHNVEKDTVDLRNYLIFGDDYFDFEVPPVKKELSDRVFEDSGYAFFYDNSNKTKLAFDFGEIGDHISAAHGHSDILHFVLEANGIPILIDSGTYQYHSKYLDWRNYFRGISAHNTISINNKHHGLPNSRMSWIHTPKVTLESIFTSENNIEVKASHNAFEKDGVIHRRTLKFDKRLKQVVIIDEIIQSKSDSNLLSFYLNFNPNLELIKNPEGLIVSYKDKKIATINNEHFKTGNIVKGDKEKLLAWYSSSFDNKTRGQLFTFNKEINQSTIFTTTIDLNE